MYNKITSWKMSSMVMVLCSFSDNGRRRRARALHLRSSGGGDGAADGVVRAGGGPPAVGGGGAHAGAVGRKDVPHDERKHVRGEEAVQAHAEDAQDDEVQVRMAHNMRHLVEWRFGKELLGLYICNTADTLLQRKAVESFIRKFFIPTRCITCIILFIIF